MRKIGVFAVAPIACLLAVSPAAAGTTTFTVDSLPYSDSQKSVSYAYADVEMFPTVTGSSGYSGASYLRFDHVDQYQHVHYVSIDGDLDLPFTEGAENYFWYSRPSDGTYQRGKAVVWKSRNVLGVVTHTQATLYFTNWELGSKIGTWGTYLYADNNGEKSSNYFSSRHGPYTYIFEQTGKGGDDLHNVGFTWLVSYNGYTYYQPVKLDVHAESYQSDTYTVTFEDSGFSIKTTLTRYVDGVYHNSEIQILDSDGNNILDDYSNLDKEYVYPTSSVALCKIIFPDSEYDYVFPASEPPSESSKFTLSLSPETGSVGSPISATLTPAADAPRYSEIAWTVSDPDGNKDVELYTKSSDDWTWTHYNKTSRRLDPSSEGAAHSLQFTPTGAGTWTVSAVVRDQQPPSSGAALAEVSATCEVERKAGNVDVVVSVFDGAKSSASYLAGVGVVVRDLTRNGTVIYDSTGEYILGASGTTNGRVTFSAPLGDQIQITAKKTGYLTATITNFVQPTALPLNQMPVAITLMPSAPPAPDEAWVTFHVTDLRSQPIEGAAVQVSDQTGITSSLGSCRIAVPTNQTLPYSVTKNGYYSASGYIMGVTENSQITVELYSSAPVTPTVTPTPGSSGPGSGTYAPGDESQIVGNGLSIFLQYYQLIAALCFLCLITGLTNLMGGKRR